MTEESVWVKIYPEEAWKFMMATYSKKKVEELKRQREAKNILVIGPTQCDEAFPRPESEGERDVVGD